MDSIAVVATLVVGIVLIGVAIILLALKNATGKMRIALLLMGTSFIGFLIFAVLHNVFYAIGVGASNLGVVGDLEPHLVTDVEKALVVIANSMEVLHTICFIIAVPICPLVFVAGGVWSLVLKERKRRQVDGR